MLAMVANISNIIIVILKEKRVPKGTLILTFAVVVFDTPIDSVYCHSNTVSAFPIHSYFYTAVRAVYPKEVISVLVFWGMMSQFSG
jgi:hypothetical protein